MDRTLIVLTPSAEAPSRSPGSNAAIDPQTRDAAIFADRQKAGIEAWEGAPEVTLDTAASDCPLVEDYEQGEGVLIVDPGVEVKHAQVLGLRAEGLCRLVVNHSAVLSVRRTQRRWRLGFLRRTGIGMVLHDRSGNMLDPGAVDVVLVLR